MMRAAFKLGMSVSEYYECTSRDVYNFIRAKLEGEEEQREQEWDNTRHIMLSVFASMTGKPDTPDKVIKLKRDKKAIEITPYTKQEIERWAAKMDKEMLNGRT